MRRTAAIAPMLVMITMAALRPPAPAHADPLPVPLGETVC
jgi:hypothetical protein